MIKNKNKDQKDALFKILDTLNEAQTRWFVAREAMLLGHGGIKKMCELTGISKPTVIRGIKELKSRKILANEDGRVRQPGAGRKKIEQKNPEIINILNDIMNETTADDLASLLKWTTKSTYQMRNQIKEMGFSISEDTIQRRLKEMGYSLQSSLRKSEGSLSREHDNQFQYINNLAKEHLYQGSPVISIDIKRRVKQDIVKGYDKKLYQKDSPKQTYVHSAQNSPYGVSPEVYNTQKINGMVNVGTSRSALEFAAEAIRRWWLLFGSKQYRDAKSIMICLSGKEGRDFQNREWEHYLQRLCNELHLSIVICHYPPGISKWNKIDYNIISLTGMQWKAEPFINLETTINVIGSPTARTGIKMKSLLDTTDITTGVRGAGYRMIEPDKESHDTDKQWNLNIAPKRIKATIRS